MSHQKGIYFHISNWKYDVLSKVWLFLDRVLKDIKHHLNSMNIAYRLYPIPIILSFSAIYNF